MATDPGRSDDGKDSANRGYATAGSSSLHYQFTFRSSTTPSTKSSFIEPDPNLETGDSSESLTESVQAFPEEFGRTYHAYRAGSYFFPNDHPEQERLSFQSHILAKLFGGRLFFAPLSKSAPPRAILDIATGMGDWAVQMGDYFPQSEIIATDLSPIQPKEVPPNVNFYVEDSSEPWHYSHTFDYIHTRETAACWHSFQEQIAAQAFENLAPGGYFESQEVNGDICCDDGTLDPNGAVANWFRNMIAGAISLNRPINAAQSLRQIYRNVGFVDVEERIFKIPINEWPKDERLKELGKMWEANLLQGLSGFSLQILTKAYDWTPEQVEVSLVDVRKELSNTQVHSYNQVFVVWGRKPWPGEVSTSGTALQ